MSRRTSRTTFAAWWRDLPRSQRLYLDVPFAQKNDAKGLGAAWDDEVKRWFISAQHDRLKFSRWIPSSPITMADDLPLPTPLTPKQIQEFNHAKWGEYPTPKPAPRVIMCVLCHKPFLQQNGSTLCHRH